MSDKKVTDEDLKKADIYDSGVSANRIVTRSQTTFLRINNTNSDLDLFANASKHQPPGQPHLMEVMKGEYGAIPRTIITRSTGKHIKVDEDLVKKMDVYKKYEPPKEEKVDVKEEKTDLKEEKTDVEEKKTDVKAEPEVKATEQVEVKEEKAEVEEQAKVKEEKKDEAN